MELPTINIKLSDTRKVVKDARFRCRNYLADLEEPEFEFHQTPEKFFACKKIFSTQKIESKFAKICAMYPNNLAEKAIRGTCKIPKKLQ